MILTFNWVLFPGCCSFQNLSCSIPVLKEFFGYGQMLQCVFFFYKFTYFIKHWLFFFRRVLKLRSFLILLNLHLRSVSFFLCIGSSVKTKMWPAFRVNFVIWLDFLWPCNSRCFFTRDAAGRPLMYKLDIVVEYILECCSINPVILVWKLCLRFSLSKAFNSWLSPPDLFNFFYVRWREKLGKCVWWWQEALVWWAKP